MMHIGARDAAAAVAALMLLSATPATAGGPGDAGSTVAAVMALAASLPRGSADDSRGFPSFRMTITMPHEVVVSITDGYGNIKFSGSDRSEGYYVSDVMYFRSGPGGWLKYDLRDAVRMERSRLAAASRPGARVQHPEQSLNSKPVYVGDHTVDGVLMSVYRDRKAVTPWHHASGPARVVTETCYVEKVTNYIRRCIIGNLYTLTMDRWDDPANIVVLPPAAHRAKPVTFAQ